MKNMYSEENTERFEIYNLNLYYQEENADYH